MQRLLYLQCLWLSGLMILSLLGNSEWKRLELNQVSSLPVICKEWLSDKGKLYNYISTAFFMSPGSSPCSLYRTSEMCIRYKFMFSLYISIGETWPCPSFIVKSFGQLHLKKERLWSEWKIMSGPRGVASLVLKTWSRTLQHLQQSGLESLSQLDLQHNSCGARKSHVVHDHGVCYYWWFKKRQTSKQK